MLAAPINASDLIPMTGAYAHRVTPPRVAGHEGVGVVIGADDVALLGTRVLPVRGDGTWADLVDCDPALAVPVPDDVGDALAARAYINPLAAHLMLRQWPPEGKRLLLTAAGSSCARLLARWAIERGAREIVGVLRTPTARAALSSLGVVPVLAEDAAGVLDASSEADLVFDAVGGALGSAIIETMRAGTDFVSYGLLSGRPVSVPRMQGGRHRRFHLRDELASCGATEWQGWFEALWPKLRAAVHPPVASFALSSWRAALDAWSRPGRVAKPLLLFDAP